MHKSLQFFFNSNNLMFQLGREGEMHRKHFFLRYFDIIEIFSQGAEDVRIVPILKPVWYQVDSNNYIKDMWEIKVEKCAVHWFFFLNFETIKSMLFKIGQDFFLKASHRKKNIPIQVFLLLKYNVTLEQIWPFPAIYIYCHNKSIYIVMVQLCTLVGQRDQI